MAAKKRAKKKAKPRKIVEKECDHQHCDCGWCLPEDAVPVMTSRLPDDPDDLNDSHAVRGVTVAIFCPGCGAGHTFSYGAPADDKPKPNELLN